MSNSSINMHIKSYETDPSYYNREKDEDKIRYLDTNLTVTKIYNDYCTSNPEYTIGYNRYYSPFITKYNLRFNFPQPIFVIHATYSTIK